MELIYTIIFLIALVGSITITLVKLYNIYRYFTTAEIYSLFTNILLFVGSAVLWVFGLMVLLENPLILLFNMSFRFISLLLVLSFVLFVIELFCCLGWAAQQTTIQPYNATKERAKLQKY